MSEKSAILAIDVGSVAVSVVKLDAERKLTAGVYRFHHGDVEKTLVNIVAAVGGGDVGRVVATASTPSLVSAQRRYDNQIAFIEAARRYHPQLLGLLVVGGEKFFYSTFAPDGRYTGSTSNTSCAAGTGSFLDQQAGRLKMKDSAELSSIACGNTGRCPKIASRCAVFAKTDLIHAQQEGYQYEEISDGLCHGLAQNIVDTLFTGETHPQEILFCGGVSKNRAVAGHIEKALGISLRVPKQGHLYGALGAALCAAVDIDALEERALNDAADVIAASQVQRRYAYPSLELSLSSYPEFASRKRYEWGEKSGNPVEVDIYEPLQGELMVLVGVDIGSTSTKAVLVDGDHRVLAGLYTRTAGRPLQAVQNLFAAIEDIATSHGVSFRVRRCATTGSGRKFIGKIIGADVILDEITAHGRAATSLDAEVDTIIEIGGQDAKFTTLRNGRVTSSTMNNVCAAGTGSFIEEQAARLGCSVEDYSVRAEGVCAPMASDRCTVFMERDINHHLSEGFSVNEVLAAALHSVRENYLMKVATENKIGQVIFFQGATAKNRALVAAFEQRLQKPIMVSKFCHLTGALGAALVAGEEGQSTAFKGFELYKKHIQVRSEVCELCTNHCKISLAETPSGTVAYGFLCGREYEDTSYVTKKGGAFDLLVERRRLEKRPVATAYRNDTVIGVPAAVHMVADLTFWQNFFGALGIKTVSSPMKKGQVSSGKNKSLSEFCAPITSMHGHVDYLLEKADYVFLPYYLENKNREARRQFCYYTQFLPGLIDTSFKESKNRILSPVVRYLYTSFHTKIELYRMLQKSVADAPGFLEISSAYDRALETKKHYESDLQRFYARKKAAAKDVEVVLVGRPYSILSPAMNCGIPSLLADQGINTYFQDMLTVEEEDISAIKPLLKQIHWQHSAEILEAAQVVAQSENLYPVYVTSFKCSPDSFTLEYFKTIMEASGKPYLILELDEHDSSVGYETRIEAAIRSFRNHRQQELQEKGAGRHLAAYPLINPRLSQSLEDKTIVLPNWDRITCTFLAATLEREGRQVHLIEETEDSIRRSLKYNNGQCIPLNAIAQGFIDTVKTKGLDPKKTVLWLNESTIACNIRLYPHHIQTILSAENMAEAGVYAGDLSLADISLRAAINGYFSHMFGGLLRRVACSIRPYEVEKGMTDRILNRGIAVLAEAFRGLRQKETALDEVISSFERIATKPENRPKVALFGDLYVRDNRTMNQDLVRFIEQHGGEVITTPYSEYAKMIATSYFRKWFNEGKYFAVFSNRAILATMLRLEKRYSTLFDRILGESLKSYEESPQQILRDYGVTVENTGESMDNILKIHYLTKHYPDISLFVQTSPALCCPSLVTEAMKHTITEISGVPVVSVVYDGTGGQKNSVIVPYLKYGRGSEGQERRVVGQQ